MSFNPTNLEWDKCEMYVRKTYKCQSIPRSTGYTTGRQG